MSQSSSHLRSPTFKRAHDTSRGRFLLGVFVVAWLNLTVQPCLMATESSPEQAAASTQSAHADHASHSTDHACDQCPPALGDHATACVSADASDCSAISVVNYDGRDGPAKPKDVPTYMAIADFAIPSEFTIPVESPPPFDCAVSLYPSEPPLSIQYCVFLK